MTDTAGFVKVGHQSQCQEFEQILCEWGKDEVDADVVLNRGLAGITGRSVLEREFHCPF